MKQSLQQCSKCGEEKPFSEFYKQKDGRFGVRSDCKTCRNKYRKNWAESERGKMYCSEYEKSEAGKNRIKKFQQSQHGIESYKRTLLFQRTNFPWRALMDGINQRCNNINNKYYHRYGGRGIQNLFKTSEEIKFLMERDGYWNMTKPSIHRIDNDGNYCLENCEFLEWEIHNKLHRVTNLKSKV